MSQTHLICPNCKRGYFITLPNSVKGLRTLKEFKNKHKRIVCLNCTTTAMPEDTIAQGDLINNLVKAFAHLENDKINGVAYTCIKCSSSYVEDIDGLYSYCILCAQSN